MDDFRVKLPILFYEAFEHIFDEMEAIYSGFDEDVPYDVNLVKQKVFADPSCVDCYRLVDAYYERARQIAERAVLDFGSTPYSNIAGNTNYFGFGIGGMIGATLVNAAASLIDYGVNRVTDEVKLRKYDKQLDELIHGPKTIDNFLKLATNMSDCMSSYAVYDIAKRIGDDDIYPQQEVGIVLKSSQYKTLSREDKTQICISALERYPTLTCFYEELVRLTEGQNDELVEYGNALIAENYGTETRQKIIEEMSSSSV